MLDVQPTGSEKETAQATFRHLRVIGKKFERASVVLDNMWFENCWFENCDVFYSGSPTETRSCRFENVPWCFQSVIVAPVGRSGLCRNRHKALHRRRSLLFFEPPFVLRILVRSFSCAKPGAHRRHPGAI